jgi:CRISPR-associated protein Cas2
MARPEHLFVFTYDVVKDGARARLATLLDEHMDRVQKSVFEARLPTAVARRLAAKAARLLGPEDSLRVYCITEAGRQASQVLGRGQLPEAADFWIV